jgi:endonuclease G, mitochondrial
MNLPFRPTLLFLFTLLVSVPQGFAQSRRFDHDHWQTTPRDIVRTSEAFILSFDSDDDNNGDRKPDRWAIPEWVAYEVKKNTRNLGPAPDRPSWTTDATLFRKGIAPNDASYHYAATLPSRPPYDRGHMCPKDTAFRISRAADAHTHTVLNACPQHEKLNGGIWKSLEQKIEKWADQSGSVWVICGPIVNGRKPSRWLGQTGEVPVAIPNAFYKIVIRKTRDPNRPDVMAFIFDNKVPRANDTFQRHLVSVDAIEAQTGLDFLQRLPNAAQKVVEKDKARNVWP